MITAKFKSIGAFALIVSVFLFGGICFFIYILISVVFYGGHTVRRGTLPPFAAIVFVFSLFILLAVIINSWIRYAFNIKIDILEKTIVFKNIITRQTTFYKFSDFDSYLDTYADSGRGNSYRVIYLIKRSKAEKIITGFYYSNIDELREAISSITYLGFQSNFSAIARKALLNKMIIDDVITGNKPTKAP